MMDQKEIAKRLVGAVAHALAGNGPASVRLKGPGGEEGGCVVFVMPNPLGGIIDDALDKLYAHLGWTVAKEGREEGK